METQVVPNTFPSLMAAYTAVWLCLSLYVFALGRRLRKIESKHSGLDEAK